MIDRSFFCYSECYFFFVGIKEFDEVNGMFLVIGFFQVIW